MKKVNALLFFALLFLIPACKKENAQTEEPIEAQESVVDGSSVDEYTPPPRIEPTLKGVMISGWYYDPVYNEDGSLKTMKANFEAIVGTQVGVYGSFNPDDENNGAEVIKDVPIDGAKKDFVHVFYDGEEYYVRDYAVAVNAEAAVVINPSTYIYTRPNLANMGKSTVPESTIVAVFSADIPEDEDKRFKKIRYYVPDGKTFTVNGYLMKSTLSSNQDLVSAMMVYEKFTKLRADGNADPTVLEELKENYDFLMENASY